MGVLKVLSVWIEPLALEGAIARAQEFGFTHQSPLNKRHYR